MKDKQLKQTIENLKHKIKNLKEMREELSRKIAWNTSMLIEMEYSLIGTNSYSSPSHTPSTASLSSSFNYSKPPTSSQLTFGIWT